MKPNWYIHTVADFENAKTEMHDVYYSRYIASWADIYLKELRRMELDDSTEEGFKYKYFRFTRGGMFGDEFKDWLRSINLTEEEVDHIYFMATNGKLELQQSAKAFIDMEVE